MERRNSVTELTVEIFRYISLTILALSYILTVSILGDYLKADPINLIEKQVNPDLITIRRQLRKIQDEAYFCQGNIVGHFNIEVLKARDKTDYDEIVKQVIFQACRSDPYIQLFAGNTQLDSLLPGDTINSGSIQDNIYLRLGLLGYFTDSGYKVVKVASGSWADLAELRPGDMVRVIPDTSKGSEYFHVVVFRNNLKFLKVNLKPERLPEVYPPDFQYKLWEERFHGLKLLYIKLSEFTPDIYLRLTERWHEGPFSRNPDVVIFDLRGCPGGSYWDAFFFVSSLFREDEYMFTFVTKNSIKDMYCGGNFPLRLAGSLPIVIQDSDTISAPELISLVVKWKGFVIGQPSGGKAFVQKDYTVGDLKFRLTYGYVSDLGELRPHSRIYPNIYATGSEVRKALRDIVRAIWWINLDKLEGW